MKEFKGNDGTSLVVQGSRLLASTAWGTGSIPGQGIRIRHAMQSSRPKMI